MVLPAIRSRRSIRTFLPDPVSDVEVRELLLAGKFAPTAHGKAAVEFIVIREMKTKQALSDLLGQEFLTEAPVLIVPILKEGVSVASVQDLSLATGFIFLQAASMGLRTVWKNVAGEFPPNVKAILGVPENYHLINIIPVGHPGEELPEHDERELKAKQVHAERF